MHLIRCQDQKNRTLDEFYAEMSNSEESVSREIGRAMLSLISRLRALPNDRHMFGLTSLHRLCLLAQDSWQSPWYVIVSALDQHNYHVEYLIPDRLAPWPKAYVRGETQTEDLAIQMILTAMEKSEGWMSP